MTSEFKHIGEMTHQPPASPQFIGLEKPEDVKLYLREYNKDFFRLLENPTDFQKDYHDSVSWIKLVGLKDVDLIKDLALKFNIHPLVLEDILNTSQRPKLEDYGDYLFLVTKDIFFNPEGELDTRQVSILLFEDKVVSFQEEDHDFFRLVSKRIEEGGNIRKFGPDYLVYSLLDSIVDNYFLVIEKIGNTIDKVEDDLLMDPDKEVLESIYNLKRDLIYIRNFLWPIRNSISSITREGHDLIKGPTVYFFRDIYDHIIQIIDLTETSRDICSGMLDTYLSSLSNKTNDIMKVLTIFSTISVPLTFLTGLYGMNFAYFPELSWRYAYLFFWLLTLLIVVIMISYFKKKDWL